MNFGIILVVLFVILLIIRVPMAFSAGIVTMLYLMFGTDFIPVEEMILTGYQSLDRFPLLAVPLFILAGQFMATGGVAKYFLRFTDELLGGMKGGYAIVTPITCVFFGALSGSAPATVAAVGTVMIPAMIKQGYGAGFSVGLAAASGVLAVIIPPSNPMIIYALACDSSIGQLFLGGFIPGFLLAAGIAIPAYLVSRWNGWGGEEKKRSLKAIIKAAWEAKWALFVPVIILGGIYSGIFTPVESAAVACIYSCIIGLFVYKEFKVSEIPGVLRATSISVVTIFILLSFATGLGVVLTIEQVPQTMVEVIQGVSENPLVILLMINIFLLFIGAVMDTAAAIVILGPLLLEIVSSFGVHHVHFGMFLIINLAIGFMTPPFGANLFVANQMTGLRIQKVFVGALPMLIGMIIAMFLVVYIPELTMFLPNLFYN